MKKFILIQNIFKKYKWIIHSPLRLNISGGLGIEIKIFKQIKLGIIWTLIQNYRYNNPVLLNIAYEF